MIFQFSAHGCDWSFEVSGDGQYFDFHRLESVTDLTEFVVWLDSIRTGGKDVTVASVIEAAVTAEALESWRGR